MEERQNTLTARECCGWCRGHGRRFQLLLFSTVVQWLALLVILFYTVLRFNDQEIIPIIYTDMKDVNEQPVSLDHLYGNMNLGNNNQSIVISKDGFYMVIVKGILSRNSTSVAVKVYYRREEKSKLILDLQGKDTLKGIMVENLRQKDNVYMEATIEDNLNSFTSLSLSLISVAPL